MNMYPQNSFSSLPATIFKLFKIESHRPALNEKIYEKYAGKARNVVVLLIDALGYKYWSQFSKHACHKISAVFPSTTANALNTISSGLLPAEHGLFEWVLYLEEIGKTINTLPFTEVGIGTRLKKEDGFNPQVLFNAETIYEKLKKHGVNSYSFVSRAYARSYYSELTRKGSQLQPFINFSDLVVNLRTAINHVSGKNYFFIYWDMLDTLGHVYGPTSEAWQTELRALSFLWQKEFLEKVDKNVGRETLILVTADHGQIDVVPEKTIYLNQDVRLMDAFAKDKQGNSILPTGGPRDVFLHLQKDKVDEMFAYLTKRFDGVATVMKMKDAIDAGFFGRKEIKAEYARRLGEILILPCENQMIWRQLGDEKINKKGHHGGLSPEEMEIPLYLGLLPEML